MYKSVYAIPNAIHNTMACQPGRRPFEDGECPDVTRINPRQVQMGGNLKWTTYTLTLLQLEQTTDSSGRRGTGPPTKPGFSQGFFSILSPMEFSFLAAVASGLLSWGHFISSTIIDLIAQILFKLN